MQFTDRVVVITGAASGIGRELARSFAPLGAHLGLVDRAADPLCDLAGELGRRGARCMSAVADVRERDQVQNAVRSITEALGPVDVLIPCAGICRASSVDDLKIAELEEVFRINFLGVVYMIEAVLPAMLERRRGHIVGISSLAGVRGIPFESAYSASKSALAAYLESLRPELRRQNIAVTTVFPGFVETPLLDEINELLGGDVSMGNRVTAETAASRIVKAVARRRSTLLFPMGLGWLVWMSQFLPPFLYDQIMTRRANHLAISRGPAEPPGPAAPTDAGRGA